MDRRYFLMGSAAAVGAGRGLLASANATLTVKVAAPKQAGQKTVIELTMKNTFKEKVESARAQVFLIDGQGKVVGQAARWVIGGTKDKPALLPDQETVSVLELKHVRLRSEELRPLDPGAGRGLIRRRRRAQDPSPT